MKFHEDLYAYIQPTCIYERAVEWSLHRQKDSKVTELFFLDFRRLKLKLFIIIYWRFAYYTSSSPQGKYTNNNNKITEKVASICIFKKLPLNLSRVGGGKGTMVPLWVLWHRGVVYGERRNQQRAQLVSQAHMLGLAYSSIKGKETVFRFGVLFSV